MPANYPLFTRDLLKISHLNGLNRQDMYLIQENETVAGMDAPLQGALQFWRANY